MQIAILGRQAGISLAELEALYGAKNITPIENYAALVHSEEPLPQSRLGGTMKSGRLLTRLEATDLAGAFKYLQEFLPEHFTYLPKGKLQFGVSVYGFKAQRDWLLKQMLTLKKVIKKTGQSIRIIENKSEALESAQILYNKLTSELGCELLLIREGKDVLVAQTTAVQDIDDYATRDFGRPKRDAFVGMLPPKLAQIMINLALEPEILELRSQSLGETANSKICILDPFCGTGVVLQEAMLMHYAAYGTDLSEKMVDYSRDNLNWLQSERHLNGNWYLEQADATTHHWNFSKIEDPSSKIYIVCETYLGTPLTTLPDTKKLEEIVHEADKIAEKFLKNISSQLKTGSRLCLALPAWYLGKSKFRHLKALDHLEALGYNRLDLVHANYTDLIYHRKDQIVARELTILEKK